LSSKDVSDFEYESHSKILFNMPPLNDREQNREQMQEFADKLEL